MYHVMTGAGLVLFSVAGKPSPVSAWRYLLFFSSLALELYLLLSPSPSFSSSLSNSTPYVFPDHTPPTTSLLTMLFPNRVAYQHVLLLHQVFFAASVALSRIGPVLFAGSGTGSMEEEGKMIRALGERILGIGQGVERERECPLFSVDSRCDYAC
ncbi:hypothetical protein HYDPIDRAFT_110158 [Hydnomerulius pinastri MD-312]|nr:hypothetical protein HYDPIDRAFT_110158 [Hydnomerulius pinastri MD-312]